MNNRFFKSRRILALFLAILMTVTQMPANAFAAGINEREDVSYNEETTMPEEYAGEEAEVSDVSLEEDVSGDEEFLEESYDDSTSKIIYFTTNDIAGLYYGAYAKLKTNADGTRKDWTGMCVTGIAGEQNVGNGTITFMPFVSDEYEIESVTQDGTKLELKHETWKPKDEKDSGKSSYYETNPVKIDREEIVVNVKLKEEYNTKRLCLYGLAGSDGSSLVKTIKYNTESSNASEDQWKAFTPISDIRGAYETEVFNASIRKVFFKIEPKDGYYIDSVIGEECTKGSFEGTYCISVEGRTTAKVTIKHDPVRVWRDTISSVGLFNCQVKGTHMDDVEPNARKFLTEGTDINLRVYLKDEVDADKLENYRICFRYYRDSYKNDPIKWYSLDITEQLYEEGEITLTIPQSFVEYAEKTNDPIYIKVVEEIKTATVELDKLDGIVEFYLYNPVKTDETGNYISGDKKNNKYDEERVSKHYGNDFGPITLCLSSSYENLYEIKGLKINDEEKAFLTDTYTKDGEEKTSLPYFVLENIKGDVTITPIIDAIKVSDDAVFRVGNRAEHADFSIDKKYATGNGSDFDYDYYKIAEGTGLLEFTITSNWNYIPAVECGGGDPYVTDRVINYSTKTVNENKKTVTYKYTDIPALLLEGKSLIISEEAAPAEVSLYIAAPKSVDSVIVTVDGSAVEPADAGKLGSEFKVATHKKAKISVKADAHYNITDIEVYDSTLREAVKTLKPDKNGVVKLTVHENMYLNVVTKGIPTVYAPLSEGDLTEIKDNSTFTIRSYYDGFPVVVYDGIAQGSYDSITDVTVKCGKKTIKDFAFIEEGPDGKYLKLYPSNVKAGTYAVTIKGDFGKKNFNVKVAPNVTSVSVAGANKNNVIKQPAGTAKSYKITVNSGAFNDDLEMFSPSKDDAAYSVYLKEGKKELFVENYNSGEINIEPVNVTFSDRENEKTWNYTIEPTKATLSTPTASVISSTDIGIILSLSLPKAMKEYANLYYKVEAKADVAKGEKCDERMKESLTEYYEVTESEAYLNLSVKECPDLNDGAKQKYKINVSLVQVIDDYAAGDLYESGNIWTEGAAKTISASTKAPAYESKLSLNEKSASLTYGETNVVLATAKWSSNTSYQQLERVELYSESGKFVTGTGYGFMWFESDKIILGDYTFNKNMIPGKYMLYVYPSVPDNTYCPPATMPVTIKAPVAYIGITPESSGSDPIRIYKAKGSAATFKLTATCGSNFEGMKPANTKLKWEIICKDPELEKALSVKNGTVTVAKNYVPGKYPYFEVKATACDMGKDSISAKACVTLTTDTIAPKNIVLSDLREVIEGVKNNPKGYVSSVFDGKVIIVEDENNNSIDLSRLNISVTPKTGFTITDEGRVYVSKAGIYTVKATMNDGSKKSVSMKFKVVNAELNAEKPYESSFGVKNLSGSESLEFDKDGDNTYKATSAVYAPDSITLSIFPKDPDGKDCGNICNNDVKVKVDGAKQYELHGGSAKPLAAPSAKEYYFVPTKGKVTITLTYKVNNKDVKEKYVIDVKLGKGKIKAKKKAETFYKNSCNPASFFFEVTGVNLSDYSNLYIETEPDYAECKNAEKTDNTVEFVRYFGFNNVSVDENNAKRIKIDRWDFEGFDKGEYPIYLTLWGEDSEGKDVPITAPQKVTFKAVSCPEPTTQIKNTTIDVKDNESGIEFRFKNMKTVSAVDYDIRIYNEANVSDERKFTTYYGWVQLDEKDEPFISLVRDTNHPIPSDLKSVTGYIEYTVIGLDGVTKVTKTEKITINFKFVKPKK